MSREDHLAFQKDFTAAELGQRRARVMAQMGEQGGGAAVVAAATEVPGFDPIRQSNDFYYLTGVEVPHAYLTMDGMKPPTARASAMRTGNLFSSGA